MSEILTVGRERQRLGDALDKHLHEAQEAYLLLELVETRDSDRMWSYPDESAEGLLVSALLCYRDCIFSDLLDRFWSAVAGRALHPAVEYGVDSASTFLRRPGVFSLTGRPE